MDKKLMPSKPLEKIALSCSGGGYRAAVFHLGSMSYLNRLVYFKKPLLENVQMLSTVSGGTITGMVYALGIQKGKSFEDIYNDLRNKLSSLDLLKTGFSLLNHDAVWPNDYKTRNLINSFALQYDKELTDGKTLGDLTKKDTHLKQIVFNSTEFTNAINFRFKSDNSKWSQSGNYYIKVPKSFQPHIKLSDIMASSSCFPGGFEPMLWPDDFKYSEISNNDIFQRTDIAKVGLMDGGIYDNQGIESILNYKIKEKPYFDLVIISDVASPYMDPFKQFSLKKTEKGFKTLTLKKLYGKLKKINTIVFYSVLSAIGLCMVYPIIYKFPNTIWTGIFLTFSFLLFGLLIMKWLLLKFLYRKADHFLSSVKNGKFKFYVEKLSNLRIEELSIQIIEPLFVNRVNSLISLLMDVFLKVTRRLNYDKLYEDKDYTYRRVSNLVRELTENDFVNRLTREKEKTQERMHKGNVTGVYSDVIGSKIKEIAETAANFGTTLWFTEEEKVGKMQDKLLASGQFTMCYNMIVYLEKLMFTQDSGFEQIADDVKEEIKFVYNSCLQDWAKFKENPMIMIDNLKF